MSQIVHGDWGQIKLPLNDGAQVTNVALTASASKTIQGTTYTDRFVGHPTLTHWNKGKGFTLRLQGVVGEATVRPTASNNEVQTTAAISYYKDNGSLCTAAIDASVTVTRPAGAVAKWNLIVLDLATGAISAVTGTDATDGTFLNTWGTSAGQLPLVGTDKLIIAAVKLSSSAAAVVLDSEIVYYDGLGNLLQERSDMPAYDEFPMEGGILLRSALLKCHTGGVARNVYASFYSQAGALEDYAFSTDWSMALSRATSEAPAQGDISTQLATPGKVKGTGSFNRYRVAGDAKLFDLFMKGFGYMKLYPDRNNTSEYYEFQCQFTNLSEQNSQGATSKNGIQFAIDGQIELRRAA